MGAVLDGVGGASDSVLHFWIWLSSLGLIANTCFNISTVSMSWGCPSPTMLHDAEQLARKRRKCWELLKSCAFWGSSGTLFIHLRC